MKKLISITAFISVAAILHAQIYNGKLAQIAQSGTNTEWVKFRQDRQIDPVTVLADYKDAFGLGVNDVMKVKKQEPDKLGFTHYRFQQYYKGIPVRAGEYLIHAKDGKAVSGNGKLVKGINISIISRISADEARDKAIAFTNAQKYMWENVNMETQLKSIKNDPSATYYPKPELIIADNKCTGIASNYKLAYKIDIFASKPLSRNYVFVDANTGDVLFTENRIMTTDVQGTAVTKYAGTQTIWTDSVSPGVYRLRETHHGNGIETYDLNQDTSYSAAVDFTDADNYWDNVNADQDEVATDAHFGAEKTYQYYFQKFGRLSYDNSNAKLISYVHYDTSYANAFWNGSEMTYGDGDGSRFGAFTSLEVCGHEITHGVDEYSANLIYQDESGAMNEAFSDIFGTCIEFYGDSINGDWNIGEDFDLTGGNGFRSMSDPKSDLLPDTYHGQYWLYNDVLDNGGVHTNMGPLCYWFYLLSVGGTGTNDTGSVYNVTGIGRDSAAAIAYRMLTIYLTTSSAYADAFPASIQAAHDLYGDCSQAVIQTSNAFYAIGIGLPLADNDFQFLDIIPPASPCGLTNAEHISARIRYNGCSLIIPAGDTIPVSFRVDGGTIVNDTIILTSPLNGGDTLAFTYSTTADFSSIGIHTVDCWVKYNHDNKPANDSLIGFQIVNKLQQNIDVGVCKINGPVSTCHMSDAEPVDIDVKFYGCDSLASGETIVFAYRVNGGSPVKDTFQLPYTVMSNDTFNYVFSTPADLSAPGNYTIDAWTEYDVDTLTSNDMFNGYVVKNPVGISFDTIGFEETNINNLILIETTNYSHAWVSFAARHTGIRGFQMTGGNALTYLDILEIPDGVNTWNINEFLSAKVNFCVDATDLTSFNMRFDLKQTDGGDIYTQRIGPGDYTKASNLRILINGVQIGGTYNPTTTNADPWVTHFINIDSMAGKQFTVTIETRNFAKDTLGFLLDNAYIDNVCFSQVSQEDVKDYSADLSLGVYPNPFNDRFTVKFDADRQEMVSIEITDLLGRTISNRVWNVSIGTNRLDISLGSLSAGMYMIKLISSKGFAVKSIIKQ